MCEEAGARSVSDLARNAVQRLIADGRRHREDQDIDEKIRVLDRLIAAVTQQLQLLSVSQVRDGSVMEAASDRFSSDVTASDHNGQREEE